MKYRKKLFNLGCGPFLYPDFCNADDFAFKRWLVDTGFRPDWRLDISQPWCCDDNYWYGIFTQHVIEHLSYRQAVFVLKECIRTMKPEAYIRICVPSLDKYIGYLNGDLSCEEFNRFPTAAVAVSYIAQMHYHKSTWGNKTMVACLTDIGFVNVKSVDFGVGTDIDLIMDQGGKAWESLYVEAQKPMRH